MAALSPDAAIIDVEGQLKDIVQNLYNLIVQAYDHHGSKTQEAIRREIQSLVQNLVKLSRTAPSVNINIPPEVMSYVENSRNPDIFTREFVETVQRMNQMLYGRVDAYRALQEQLALHVSSAIPELREDVTSVVESTGGKMRV
ncbi:RNA polymerase II mediator complex subunit [Alternaria novae-zelandiae]|uniref:RNA polymerase II mediator complex subunit n=1 Tax=Alternaria metachromatica TaxID=283354 RepID=UPI0020C1BADB|nr:RNA polymerase II mediator complex subunit [Alternaria metachromatica]XP_049207219.1 RNA polymerase II mediator complex subunit [Alternaria viburni]XP_049224158.1 RNA polymerase II mediator complex subunit [Alternaria triticimaculans]XP_049231045.1 RNA polymerase II mediator complex subunit [Alternaria ethzedia]XP_049243005.1 RNA polymerase II mediator complex subunit [Alternaria hordeiaustralica]XP_049259643.1 RNA polymerase II mediator complex subunit [Alternaria novae-zelandiae]XP_05135